MKFKGHNMTYVKEGTERARNYNQYMKEYEDLTIFSKLRSEWKK